MVLDIQCFGDFIWYIYKHISWISYTGAFNVQFSTKKHGLCKFNPHTCNGWPWDFWIVIVKAGLIGNSNCLNWKGISAVSMVNVVLAHHFLWIYQFRILLWLHCLVIFLLLLERRGKSNDSKKNDRTFRLMMCGGCPHKSREFKN